MRDLVLRQRRYVGADNSRDTSVSCASAATNSAAVTQLDTRDASGDLDALRQGCLLCDEGGVRLGRSAVAEALDDPLLAEPPAEGADRLACLGDGPEALAREDLLFELLDEPLGDAVALGLTDVRRRVGDAEPVQLAGEVVADVLRSVVVTQRDAPWALTLESRTPDAFGTSPRPSRATVRVIVAAPMGIAHHCRLAQPR